MAQHDRNVITNNTTWDRLHSILHDLKRMQVIKGRLNLMKIEENGAVKIISVRYHFKSLLNTDCIEKFSKAKTRIIICSYEGSLINDDEGFK